MTPSDIVHIGYHKTASTWFQKRFYPCVRSHRYVERRRIQEAFLHDTAFRFEPSRARLVLAAEEAERPLILCEEELSGNYHSGGMRGSLSKDIAERLVRTLPQARIVVFIRNQVEMACTLYRSYVREGGTHRPERYLCPERYLVEATRHPFRLPLFSFDHLDYGGLIGRYRELFGAERVDVFLFEAFRADPAKFAARFAHRLGLEVDTEGLDYSRENVGLGRNALALGRLLNRLTHRSVLDKRYWFTGMSNKLRSDLPLYLNRTSLGGRNQSPNELLGSQLVAAIEERFGASNRRLAEQLGLPLREAGYPWRDE